MKIKTLFLVIVFSLFLAGVSLAGTFKVDPTYSTMNFRIKHLTGVMVGIFEKFDGTFNLSEDNQDLQGLTLNIDVTSVNTRNNDRDKDLRSEHFFDTEKFPQAKFVLTKIVGDEIVGDFTMKGITKPIQGKLTINGMAVDQYGRTKCALTIKGTINRQDFGVSHNIQTTEGKWLLSDNVDLWLELEGILEK